MKSHKVFQDLIADAKKKYKINEDGIIKKRKILNAKAFLKHVGLGGLIGPYLGHGLYKEHVQTHKENRLKEGKANSDFFTLGSQETKTKDLNNAYFAIKDMENWAKMEQMLQGTP
eukprot:Sdes_comp20734_c0_seq1m16549